MTENIHKSAASLIGGTPLLELCGLEKKFATSARLLAKLEYLNPGGSVKDRAALAIIEDAEHSGRLKPAGVIIEPTSGNTGVGLAAIAAARGYKMIVVMPESMSEERKRLIKAYGATLVLTPAKEGMKGAIKKAEAMLEETPGAILAGQFVNPANPQAHFSSTGPEIYADTAGNIDILICGVGTGGTLTGAGRYLKSQNPSIRVIAVEPASSPVISGGQPGSHKIQGIGPGFLPDNLDKSIIDEVITVSDGQAMEMAALIGRTEGFLCGISGGAALHAAVEIGRRPENKGKTIVVILPDGGERYLSMGLYDSTVSQ